MFPPDRTPCANCGIIWWLPWVWSYMVSAGQSSCFPTILLPVAYRALHPSYILPLDFPSNIRTSPSIFCFYCLPTCVGMEVQRKDNLCRIHPDLFSFPLSRNWPRVLSSCTTSLSWLVSSVPPSAVAHRHRLFQQRQYWRHGHHCRRNQQVPRHHAGQSHVDMWPYHHLVQLLCSKRLGKGGVWLRYSIHMQLRARPSGEQCPPVRTILYYQR